VSPIFEKLHVDFVSYFDVLNGMYFFLRVCMIVAPLAVDRAIVIRLTVETMTVEDR
jgi:hypothetical protein